MEAQNFACRPDFRLPEIDQPFRRVLDRPGVRACPIGQNHDVNLLACLAGLSDQTAEA
jgi:hypothetical protein